MEVAKEQEHGEEEDAGSDKARCSKERRLRSRSCPQGPGTHSTSQPKEKEPMAPPPGKKKERESGPSTRRSRSWQPELEWQQ